MARRARLPDVPVSSRLRRACWSTKRETTADVDAVVAAIIDECAPRGDAALIELHPAVRPPRPDGRDAGDRGRTRSRPRCAPAPPTALAALDLARRPHRGLPSPPDAGRRSLYRRRPGCALGWRWTALDRRRPLCAGRHRRLSRLGADERRAGQGRRRRAPGHGGAGAATARSIRWSWPRRGSPGSTRSTASAAPRRSRRWPMAPQTIRPVDKIVGPGNAYVAAAKRQVFGTVGIDMIAGPSEILVVADGANDPDWIAADLLSQAEHDTAAQSILITDDAAFADAVARRSSAQLATAAARRPSPARAGGITAPSSWCADLDDGAAAGRPHRARASRTRGRRSANCCGAGPPCRRDLPRPLYARGGRRLCRRSQPCAADRAHRPLLLGARRARFHEAHDAAAAASRGRCARSVRPR